MVDAVMLDFYGTVVYEDDTVIRWITERIRQTGRGAGVSEIGSFWWSVFSRLCENACGAAFRPQRELEAESLRQTILHFGSSESAEAMSERLFDYWVSPPLFEDSARFFAICPVPVYIISNIDTQDIVKALAFHRLRPAGLLTSEEARAYKPHKRVFDAALQKFGLSQSNTVYIGDSLSTDIRGANAAGIRAIWLNRLGKAVADDVRCSAASLTDALKTEFFG